MAIYKGREVSLVHDIPKGYIEPVTMHVRYKDGSIEAAKLSELQFTKEEKSNLEKSAGQKYENINVIEDKDLKDLRDSQDPKKIEENQKNEPEARDVTISATNAKITEGTKPMVKK